MYGAVVERVVRRAVGALEDIVGVPVVGRLVVLVVVAEDVVPGDADQRDRAVEGLVEVELLIYQVAERKADQPATFRTRAVNAVVSAATPLPGNTASRAEVSASPAIDPSVSQYDPPTRTESLAHPDE